MTEKVWFITGASRGFGRVWTEAALSRGYRVVATARNVATLNDFNEKYGDRVLTLPLDVTDDAQVRQAVDTACQHFGRLDVVLNNAGYALVGAIEEVPVTSVKAEFDTNFFGPLHVIQAVLPVLRKQQSGHIISVSSVAGLVAGPVSGLYHSSKWAVEALHESLSHEVSEFGIRVTLLEPGAYATEFASQTSLDIAQGIDAYATIRQRVFAHSAEIEFGEPAATADIVLKIVETPCPPLRVFLGTEGLPAVKAAYTRRLAEWEEWQGVAAAAQGNSVKQSLEL
ncbi:SDR family oxidoreductase [Musicola paradisiaca]|uniref:Short-chain dehydrogenase/reductase SDR n=1 Tax=Musicola paradisiaca (strain Ech703) TaxID=579405 RepID=C6CD11_MUSP7|nr:SDR family oxidoreductase [Musicola paradisiaca]ACS85052.1 short-chain dehydrogenase/reductase SDR [Musicola paradisiaca Ech703]